MVLDELKKSVKNLSEIPFKAHHSIPVYAEIIDKFNTIFLLQIDTLLSKSDLTDSELADGLRCFLAEHWEKFKNTALCYTAQPNSPVTKLCCDIAGFVANNLGLSIVAVLMPTVSVESLCPEKYPELNHVENIIQLLNTHIVGRQGKYLIPVKCIADYDEAKSSIDLHIYNPYYDYRMHEPAMNTLNKEEIYRLIEHSQLTKNVYDAKKEFENLSMDQSNLLGQLKYLLRHMYYNSTNGVGDEDISGLMISQHIYNFMSYYDALDAGQIASVPRDVGEEINAIKSYVSDQTQNTMLGSCLVTRYHALLSAMQNQEEGLSAIGMSEATKISAIQEAKRRLLDAKNILTRSVQENEYIAGTDKLSIPIALIIESVSAISFRTFDDVYLLKHLSASEIVVFLTENQDKREEVIRAIRTFRNLLTLVTEFSLEQFERVLSSLEPLLSEHFLTSGNRYLGIITALDKECRALFWEQYRKQLSAKVSPQNISDLFAMLNETQQHEFYDGLLVEIPKGSVIQDAEGLFTAIQNLKQEWRLGIIQAYKKIVEHKNQSYFFTAEELLSIYGRIEHQISEISSKGINFIEESEQLLMSQYVLTFMRPAPITPYKNSYAFFKAMVMPFIDGIGALCVLFVFFRFLIKGLINLLFCDFSQSILDAKQALIYLQLVLLLMVLAALMLPVIMTRAISTAVAPVVRMLSRSDDMVIDVLDNQGTSVYIPISSQIEMTRV